jgi:spore germination protein Q
MSNQSYDENRLGTPYASGMPGTQSPSGWWSTGYPDTAMPYATDMTGVSPFMTTGGFPGMPSDMTGVSPFMTTGGFPGMPSDITGVSPFMTTGGFPGMPTDMTGVSPFMTASGIPSVPSGAGITPTGGSIVTVPQEESYIENILRLNRGKLATVYMTFENNSQWNAKVFRGIIEAAGRDHLILSDPSTGTRYLLLMVNLDYITFQEPINYEYPFQGGIVTQQTPFNTTRENETETDYTDLNTQA